MKNIPNDIAADGFLSRLKFVKDLEMKTLINADKRELLFELLFC